MCELYFVFWAIAAWQIFAPNVLPQSFALIRAGAIWDQKAISYSIKDTTVYPLSTHTHRHRYIDKLSCQSNCLPAQRQLLLPLLLLLPSVQLQMDKCCLTFTRLSTLPLPPSPSLYLSPLHTHRRKHNKATHNDCTHAFSPL